MNTQWSRALFWLFSCWVLSSPAFADGYKKGLDAFRDGEYSKAYKILSGVAKKSKDKSDKAEAMALMGAAAAKMGKKGKAESLFSKALKTDPDVSLSKDAVKDKSVRKMFAKVKKGSDEGGEDEEDSGDDGFEEESKSERSEKSASKGGTSFKGFIPLGLGFLFSGEVTKGLIYGGAQAAGVIGIVLYNAEITKANADADAVGQQAIAQGGAPDQETLDFLDQNEAFVKSTQNNQKLMALVLGAGYGLGIVDGLIFGSSKKSRKKRSAIPQANPHVWAMESKADEIRETEEEHRPWGLKMHLLPKQDPGLMLSINRSF